MGDTTMRPIRLLFCGASCALTTGAVACASIVGFPDVPGVSEDASVPHDGHVVHDAGVARDAHLANDASKSDAKAHDAGRDDAGPDAMTDARTTVDARGDAPATSCTPDGATCGDKSDPCCASLAVPGGAFNRVNAGPGDAGGFPATVSTFRLDEFLVTVGRFRRFVTEWKAGYRPATGSGKHSQLNGGRGLSNVAEPATFETGWATADEGKVSMPSADGGTYPCPASTWTPAPGAQEELPINCITWPTAYAFCIWDGGFLPSEAEWQYAAVGGTEQRDYPWGSFGPGVTTDYAIFNCNYGAPGLCSGTLAHIAPVGTAKSGLGVWGQFDLVGEVFEWTLDYYAPYVAGNAEDGAYLSPYVSDAGGVPYPSHVTHGGDFEGVATYLSPTFRSPMVNSSSDTAESANIGVRCARTP